MVLRQKSGSQIQESLKRNTAEFEYELIEPAVRPLRPIKPSKPKMLVMGFLVGMMIGIGIIFLMEYNDESFKDIDELEEYLGLIVLCTVPRIEIKHDEPGWRNYLKVKFLVPAAMMLGGVIFVLVIILN